jgi:hypothetical protein
VYPRTLCSAVWLDASAGAIRNSRITALLQLAI